MRAHLVSCSQPSPAKKSMGLAPSFFLSTPLNDSSVRTPATPNSIMSSTCPSNARPCRLRQRNGEDVG